MKKTYIKPATMIVAIEIKNTLLTGSDPESQTLSVDGGSIDNGNEIGARRRSLWDDDED